MNKSKIMRSLACILQQHEKNEMSRKVLVEMKWSWNVTLPTSPVRFHVCWTSGSRLQTERSLFTLQMSPPPSSPEHVCFYWHPGSDVSGFVWMMDVSTECRWHCQLLPTTHMPPTHQSSPQTACLTAQIKHKAHTRVYILLIYPEKESRQQPEPQRSEVAHNVPTEEQNYYKNCQQLWKTLRRKSKKSTAQYWRDSKRISTPTFFVRHRRDLTRINWFLLTIIVTKPRYNIAGEKQDGKNRIWK